MNAPAKVPPITNAKQFIRNALVRSMQTLMPGYYGSDTKHNAFYRDYGYPEVLAFSNYYQMWERNGLATAGVNKPIETCWQSEPYLQEREESDAKTPLEKEIKKEFERLQFWSLLTEADRFSRIGEYSGVIFRFRDSLEFDQPVTSVTGGLSGIAEIIIANQGQLTVGERYSSPSEENYGKVRFYVFDESAILDSTGQAKTRKFNVHPDRVHIWSKNFTVDNNQPALKSGFNDLITIQKIIGAGGEGFWKNAKAAPVLEIDKEMNLNNLATMLDADGIAGIPEKMDEIIGDYQKGYDQMLMIQGMKTTAIDVNLADPKEYFLTACQSLAASLSIPMKILVGSQTGERASTEDAKEWNKTCNSRITTYIKPNIMRIIARLVNFNILPQKDWYLLWADLTESGSEEKASIATKMADMNQKMLGSGEQVFTVDEMREVMGWQPLAKPNAEREVKKEDPTTTD